MKTMKFRLLATIITLAAVITATTTNAQRRSTSDSKNEKKVENTRTGNKSNIGKKSTFREDAKELNSTSRSVNSNHEVKRNNSSASETKNRETSRNSAHSKQNDKNKSELITSENRSNQFKNENRERTENRTKPESNKRKGNSEKAFANAAEMPRRSTGNTPENNRSNNNDRYSSNRSVVSNSSERYNHNTDDVRYRPNRDYKGSDKYWSSDFRGDNRNKNHYNGNQNYNNYKHWDRNWESYRWNHNSWRNYYGYYNPYSYQNHKYYYHHHYYGHVIRKFVYRPQIYIHNHVRYYSYDGFFFRYRNGVGYVLVDLPFGFAFEYLPEEYERVYVNGYLYFRVGNLFFERTSYGYQLVHYPERYFSYNDGYDNEGFRFNDMNF
jgi:hypothetical protein